MSTPVLTPDKVRTYIQDFGDRNYLIEGEEFSDGSIELAMDMAMSDYNNIPPLSRVNIYTFPSVSALLFGTLAHLLIGKAAHLARNTMAYSDGGVQIPVEERSQLYLDQGNAYMAQFRDSCTKLKVHLNIEAGWGGVSSDYNTTPLW